MKINLKSISILISFLFSSVALFLHGYLGHFTRYIADDFCTAFQAGRLGIFRAAWFWYLTWSGRFSASILDGAIGRLGPRFLAFLVPLTIVLWLAALTILLMGFLALLKNKFLTSLALATTTLFALFLLTPDIKGSLYWGQGMRSVVPPLILGTIQIILLRRIRSREWTKRQLVFWGILNFFWALVAGGFSETYVAFQVEALFLLILIMLIVKKSKSPGTLFFLLSGALGALCALIIIFLAPGNSERLAFYSPPSGILSLLTISLKSFLFYMATLGNSPEKLFAILGLFGIAVIVGSELLRETDSHLLIVIPCLAVVFIFTCFLPAAYALSDAPPNRTLILPTYFFLISLLALGLVCGNLFGKKYTYAVSTWLPGLVIVAVIISVSINSINLYRSRSAFVEYAALWDQVDANIWKSKQEGATQVVIPVIQNWAALNTPNDNPKFWLNVCMSGYYGVQILASTNPAP